MFSRDSLFKTEKWSDGEHLLSRREMGPEKRLQISQEYVFRYEWGIYHVELSKRKRVERETER